MGAAASRAKERRESFLCLLCNLQAAVVSAARRSKRVECICSYAVSFPWRFQPTPEYTGYVVSDLSWEINKLLVFVRHQPKKPARDFGSPAPHLPADYRKTLEEEIQHETERRHLLHRISLDDLQRIVYKICESVRRKRAKPKHFLAWVGLGGRLLLAWTKSLLQWQADIAASASRWECAVQRLAYLQDLEVMPLAGELLVEVAAAPPPASVAGRSEKGERLEIVGRRELTLAAGSRVRIFFECEEALREAAKPLPPSAAAAALRACAKFHAATALAEGASPGEDLLSVLLAEIRDSPRELPIPCEATEAAYDYVKPMRTVEEEFVPPTPEAALRENKRNSPSFGVATAAAALPATRLAPALEFLQRAVEDSLTKETPNAQDSNGGRASEAFMKEGVECVLLGAPTALMVFFARKGRVYGSTFSGIRKVRHWTERKKAPLFAKTPSACLSPEWLCAALRCTGTTRTSSRKLCRPLRRTLGKAF